MPDLVQLGWFEMAILLAVPLAAILGSVLLRLGLTSDLTVGTLRSLVQLVAVGAIIGWVFENATWYWILLVLATMTAIAGFTGSRRSGVRLPGFAVTLSLLLAAVTAVTMVYITKAVIGIHEWDPRYLIPLAGIMLGNGMTSATLAVERLATGLKQSGSDVEVWLALGASPDQAVHGLRQAAVRAALTPFINTMMIVAIVQLPGVMTGNLLAGTPPLQAALYQFLIIVVLAWVALAMAVLSTRFVIRRFFTEAWQLDREALARATD